MFIHKSTASHLKKTKDNRSAQTHHTSCQARRCRGVFQPNPDINFTEMFLRDPSRAVHKQPLESGLASFSHKCALYYTESHFSNTYHKGLIVMNKLHIFATLWLSQNKVNLFHVVRISCGINDTIIHVLPEAVTTVVTYTHIINV